LPGSAKTAPVRPLEWRNAEGTFGPNAHNPIRVDKSIEKNQMTRDRFQSRKVDLGPTSAVRILWLRLAAPVLG
jgi:hypothetical protein